MRVASSHAIVVEVVVMWHRTLDSRAKGPCIAGGVGKPLRVSEGTASRNHEAGNGYDDDQSPAHPPPCRRASAIGLRIRGPIVWS